MDDSKDISFSDSVFMGDVNNITNNYQNVNRITCPQCQASGNITTFVCKGTNLNNFTCDNMYCEHCKIDTFPNICRKCINQIDEHKRQEQNRIIAEKNEKNANLAETGFYELDSERSDRELRDKKLQQQRKQISAMLFRKRRVYVSIVHFLVITLLIYSRPSQSPGLPFIDYLGMIIFSIGIIFLSTEIVDEFSNDFTWNVENGYWPNAARLYLATIAILTPLFYFLMLKYLTWDAFGILALGTLIFLFYKYLVWEGWDKY